ncbi:MAG: DUF5125 domain-containing protein [Tannerellaceae bacterium]|jgi:hypothetical protein|nr:DUF5125 domain-containing protein [Tannerellaceae bacterium]
MKRQKYLFLILTGVFFLTACDEDINNNDFAGNPVIKSETQFTGALFGDSLTFTVEVNDELPLSTLKTSLYFGDEKVSEKIIRTKENGKYTGKIFVPYYVDIPDGTATLEFILQNTHLATAKLSVDVPVARPDYLYLALVAEDAVYAMERTGLYEYTATRAFPTEFPAYIKAPAMGDAGNEILFGWDNSAGKITQGVNEYIPFATTQSGKYSITFNTKTYEATPFVSYLCNNTEMSRINNDNFAIDLELTQGQDVVFDGIGDIAEWWIDPDFFTKASDNRFTFVPIDGKYRIIADIALKYFKVEAMLGSELATLQTDGSGAVWIIGDNVGKPSEEANYVGWNTDKALCMSPIGNKKYQLTVVAGKSINRESINFKFFHQKGWGGEFNNTTLTASGDIVIVGDGSNGRDPGNLGLVEPLIEGLTYVFVVDVSAGINNAVLNVTRL